MQSKERSRHAKPLRTARFQNTKDVNGYNQLHLRKPVDRNRAQLATLDLIDRCEDLMLYRSIGTGKTHLAVALSRFALYYAHALPILPATGLPMRLRHTKQENQLNMELRQIAKARPDYRLFRLHANRRGGFKTPAKRATWSTWKSNSLASGVRLMVRIWPLR
ncbi:ATP-binding protein [Bifidobacterium dentium]|uniref:ATP-binding protein n=1 Tax=Bifidobacterium dentium TaxID=1689 RepID=UPI0026DD59D1|nr:ATP-binding protein [Bifidobacterium dentium]